MKPCRRHFPEKPIVTPTLPCVCQGLCLMKQFRLKHAEKECRFEEIPGPSYKTAQFLTGSSYDGECLNGSMHGYGVYTFPNGVVYEGEFKDGNMHGKGELRYQTTEGKVIIQGQWMKGILTKRTLIFDDSEYNKRDWKYCKMPNRRYAVEYNVGLQPAGDSFLTNYKPPRELPQGCYDVGDGIYDPVRKLVYVYDLSKIIRRPSIAEQKWIQDNCRIGKMQPLGPQPELYESFLQPTMQVASEPQPEAKNTSRDNLGH